MTAVRLLAIPLAILIFTGACARSGKTAGQTIDDAKITTTVKAKLTADKPSNLTRVSVETNNGVVSLNGSVDTPEQKARAAQLAAGANGVKQVVNNLQVELKR